MNINAKFNTKKNDNNINLFNFYDLLLYHIMFDDVTLIPGTRERQCNSCWNSAGSLFQINSCDEFLKTVVS